jgi:GMP synthase (glutamine-hydrolysing)
MKDSLIKRLAGAFIVGVAVFILAATAVAENAAPVTAKAPVKDKRPWIMVSLAPDGCTRGCRNAFNVIRELSGNPNGHILHFSEMTYDLVAHMKPEFIILSPQGTPWCRYTGKKGVALQNFLWMLPLFAEEMHIPMLGICGGHQALALAFGGKVGPIRALGADCMPYSRDRQSGVVALTLKAQDPIFNGMRGTLRVLESHYDEVKVLPPGFLLLASDKVCRNQIMRHPTRPVYGIQGHPEYFYRNRPDGKVFIQNFLRIAESYDKAVQNTQWMAARGVLSPR